MLTTHYAVNELVSVLHAGLMPSLCRLLLFIFDENVEKHTLRYLSIVTRRTTDNAQIPHEDSCDRCIDYYGGSALKSLHEKTVPIRTVKWSKSAQAGNSRHFQAMSNAQTPHRRSVCATLKQNHSLNCPRARSPVITLSIRLPVSTRTRQAKNICTAPVTAPCRL